MHSVHLVFHGRVQGVGFRAFVMRHARALAVGGEVSNLPDGAVEVTAEGPAEALAHLLEEIRRGPVAARVARLEVSWSEGDGRYRGFDIRD